VNMPLIMGRRVLIRDEHGQMVPDPKWHADVKTLYASLVDYLVQKKLIDPSVQVAEDIASVVLREGDLTDSGRVFWHTGVVAKWLGSFDRSPHKDVRDYTQLERVLAKIG
jgi:hypothetical protein